MSKKSALYTMLIGAGISIYDFATEGSLYKEGKPLAGLRMKVYTTKSTPPKDWYISVSDAAAVIGAYFYFR